MVDIIAEDTDVATSSGVVVETTEEAVIDGVERDIEVTFDNNEFSIVGDDMVVLTRYEDAPQWMKDVINNLVDVKASLVVGDLEATREALDAMLTQLDVAKNTYELSIVSSNDIDQRITNAITSLNSSLQAADATILDIAQTAVTPNEASAIALNTLSASLSANGTIGSALHNLQTAMTTLEGTTASDISFLESVMQGEVEGNATALSELRTHVGIDEDGGLTGTGLLSDVKILQKQNDGVIETNTGTWDVMIGIENPNNNTDNDQLDTEKEPYATWKSIDALNENSHERSSHLGDVYIKYTNAAEGYKTYDKAYKFIKVVPDSTSPYSTDSEGFTWAVITDTDVQNAYVAALNALDLADNKRRVFVTTPTVPYDIGDLWVRVVSGSSQIWRCNFEGATSYSVTHWTLASTDDNAVVLLANGTTSINLTNAFIGTTPLDEYIGSEIDGKIGVYSGITAPVAGQPSGVSINDIYLWMTTASKVLANGTTQTYDVTKTYKYSGSAWVEVTTNNNITALADLADGKRTVFSGITVPIGAVSRDLWIPSDTNGSYLKGEIYQYNGTSWVLATRYSADIEAVRSNLQTQVDGKVETYYSSTVPVGMTIINNGDYWYCTADVSTYKKGKVYKYVHSTTSWIETADVSRYAFDLADGKAAIFSSTSVPTTGYKINDMLIIVGSFNNGTTTFSDGVVLSSTATRASGFTTSDWIKKINDTEKLDEFVNNIYTPAVTDLQNQVDNQVRYYFYTSSLGETNESASGSISWTIEAKKEHHGDIAYDRTTDTGYYYDKGISVWRAITGTENAGVIEALKAASIAQATADGVVVSYYAIKQDIAPATTDLWLNKTGIKVLKKYTTSWVNVDVKEGDTLTAYDPATNDTSVYVYYGTGWITDTENGMVASSESITNLKSYLGTDGGTSTLVNDITSKSTLLGKSVDSRFEYNSNIVLNGVTYDSGFGLVTSLTAPSGSVAPPAGTSEFWIKADKFKMTTAGYNGPVYSPFSVNSTNGEITFNGKVTFSNVLGVVSGGGNILYNSAPKKGSEKSGWSIGSTTMPNTAIGAGFDTWYPTGGASVYIVSVTSLATSSDFMHIYQKVPCVAGKRYEASAYLSSHRASSKVILYFRDSAGNILSASTYGNAITEAHSGSISTWGRTSVFATAPAGCATIDFVIEVRGVGSYQPYCFISNAYLGIASESQTSLSNWSEGISAGATTTGELTNDAGFTTLGAVASQGYVLPAGVADAINTNTTTINGSKITTGSVTAAQITADSALVNKLNITGGLVANNLRVPGVNGGNDLLSASGDKVVISNLKVLGTVSMPGISKGGSFSVPSLPIGSSHTVTVYKPYECTNWSLTAIVTLTNITQNGNPLNFGCTLYINGNNVASALGVAPWAINVGTSGTKGSITAGSVQITIATNGFGEGSGSFYGTISYIAIVEN